MASDDVDVQLGSQVLARADCAARAPKEFIAHIRQGNDAWNEGARAAVETLIANSAPSAWLWVYELVQNAIDAGARRVRVLEVDDGVRFEHDGTEPLKQSHVEALCGLGRSTKGLTTVGFMGVGFKSVFHRFRSARVSAGPWRFRFDVGEDEGALRARVPRWFDAVRPFWDHSIDAPAEGFTTRFDLSRPWTDRSEWRADVDHLAHPDDATSLAVLAVRGLKSLEARGNTWDLMYEGARTVTVQRSGSKPQCWLVLKSPYRPGPNALRRFIEVRRNLRADVVTDECVVNRQVFGLVPLDDDGIPIPRKQGHAYATLPTSEPVPFAIDIQADWLVDLPRQRLREVEGDAWQEEIVAQVPALLAEYLDWTRQFPRERLAQALSVLAPPDPDASGLVHAFATRTFVEAVGRALAGAPFVPVLIGGTTGYATGTIARLLPPVFETPFARDTNVRGDILFGRPIVDAEAVGDRARGFLAWLEWCPAVAPGDVQWPATLDAWQAALPSDDARDAALLELWGCLSKEQGWDALPSVRTAANNWIAPGQLRRLNEAEPDDDQPGGMAVRRALAARVSRNDEVLPTSLRAKVDRSDSPGGLWIRQHERVESLVEAIRNSYDELARQPERDDAAFLALPVWALSRGAQRADLVPLVLADDAGARPPKDVLLACDGVPGAEARRQLFRGVPVIDGRYFETTQDGGALLVFLTGAGLQGSLRLREVNRSVQSARGDTVAALLGVPREDVTAANASGYTVRDADWTLEIEKTPPTALADWLEAEYSALIGRGRKRATWKNYTQYDVRGTARATWVERLERHPWVPCIDGLHRRPTNVLAELTVEYSDAPVTRLSVALLRTLEHEGILWGKDVPKAPVLRRLQQTTRPFDADGLASVVAEATVWIETHPEDQTALLRTLPNVELDGRPLSRWVRAVGSAGTSRSGLDGWVEALPGTLAAKLARVPGYVIAETTTASMALSFLRDVWSRAAAGVEVKIDRRRVIPIAYRYVMGDDSARAELREFAMCAPESVLLFSRNGWVSLADKPIVDDMADERLGVYLADGRPLVRGAHLTDDPGRLAELADVLGLQRLSSVVGRYARVGADAPEPAFNANVGRILELLSRDSDTARIGARKWVGDITIHFDGRVIPLGARLDEATGVLWLVADRNRMTGDLVPLLIAQHALSQRGPACALLSLALATVDEPRPFAQNLRRLASALNVDESRPEVEGETGEVGFPAQDAEGPSTVGLVESQSSGVSDPGADERSSPESTTNGDGFVEFDGRRFSSVDAAVQALSSRVEGLGLGEAKKAEAVAPPTDRLARQGRGGEKKGGEPGAFSAKSSIVGRLGELYAQRWLREAPGRSGAARVIDVSTTAARAAGTYPTWYGTRDSSISPGCDILVFEDGDDALPVGYEIKSRCDTGPIEFVWSRRQEEACRRARDGERDPQWPLADYRVLVVSELLAAGSTPSVAVLTSDECLKAAEATAWLVRAKAEI